jgi:DNA-binding CsgD family transcriptional regulator
LQSQALLSQSKVAKRQQDYNKSLLLLEKADILKDSVQRLDNRKKMENWEKVYALEKLNAIDRSVISSWNPEKIFYMMAGIVAILTCIIILLYLIYKHKDKTLKHKELREQQLRQEQSERIAAEEVKSKEMQEEIDQRNRQLTTYTLEKLRLNECLADISNELRQVLLEINPRSKEHKERLQGLLKKLLHLDARNDWEEFQYYFEQVHPRFYEKLEAAFPTLTVKEKRLCAFISLGLSTKEIAAITFREVRSCESSRNRLRKKMGVSPDTDLTAFLRHLTH